MNDHTEGGKYRMLENAKGDVLQEGDEMCYWGAWNAVHPSFVGDKVYLTKAFRRPVAQEPVTVSDDAASGGLVRDTAPALLGITFASRNDAIDALVRKVFGAEPVYLDECRSVASEPDPVVEAMNADARRLEKQGQPIFTDLLIESGLPPFPPVPEGYDRWEYRGVGWKSAEKTIYAFKSGGYRGWIVLEGSAEGHDRIHYIEAVKDITPPPPTREPVEVVGVIDVHGRFNQSSVLAAEWDESYPDDAPHRDAVLVEKLP